MKRRHLFEFSDLDWLPEFLRSGLTDLLGFATTSFFMYKDVIPHMQKVIEHSEKKRVVDLCSGGGGAVARIQRILDEKYHQPFLLTLTDMFPSAKTFKYIARHSDKKINYVATSVDARNVPLHLDGIRSLFIAFHHFRPNEATSILKDASDRKTPIIIVEITHRNFVQLLGNFFLPLSAYLLTPVIKPFRISRLLFTYVIPLIPLLYFWDGMVSVFRTYRPDEMMEMTKEFATETYYWEAGRLKKRYVPSITYMIGYPL
jgi:hypothetical protein